MLFLGNNVQEKTSQKVKTDEILKACACCLCFGKFLMRMKFQMRKAFEDCA